jgi:hypothetical protein
MALADLRGARLPLARTLGGEEESLRGLQPDSVHNQSLSFRQSCINSPRFRGRGLGNAAASKAGGFAGAIPP